MTMAIKYVLSKKKREREEKCFLLLKRNEEIFLIGIYKLLPNALLYKYNITQKKIYTGKIFILHILIEMEAELCW